MLKTADLEAAVVAGVVTRENADALLEFARMRRAIPPGLGARDDERFRFLKGFNDVFLTTGVVLIALAAAGVSKHWLTSVLATAAMWGLSYILVKREKAVLPGIALSIAFTIFFTGSLAQLRALPAFAPMTLATPQSSGFYLLMSAAALFASGLYYYRFRLPFALLLVAALSAATVITAVVMASGVDLGRSSVESMRLGNQLSLVGLLCGLAIFAFAMHFDMSDPDRLTRRSDCGFWLHLAAAPIIVHASIAMFGAHNDVANTGSSLLILVIVAVLALVAIVVDRRALLVSSLLYLIAALSMLMEAGAKRTTEGMAIPLVLVGVFVLVLGLYWHPLRSKILAPFKDNPILKRLPPLHA